MGHEVGDLDMKIRIEEKRFAGVNSGEPLLKDLAIDVGRGEVVALMGPSGGGKTTILKVAAGLDHEYEGHVTFAGRPDDSPASSVSMMFQEARLLPWYNVRQNVEFGLRAEAGSAAGKVLAGQCLALVDMVGESNRYPSELSGGMSRRVALARTLASDRPNVLLDEPFSALDSVLRWKLQARMREWAAERGQSILLVTHDPDEAVFLADRILILGGRPASVLHEIKVDLAHPRQRSQAAFTQLRQAVVASLERFLEA